MVRNQRDEPISAYTQTFTTADRTVPDATAAALTDSSGGVASQTLTAIAGTSAGTAGTTNEPCETATKNAIASLADEINKLIIDVADIRQSVTALIDDLQTRGVVG